MSSGMENKMSNDKIRLLKIVPPSFLEELCIKNEEIYLLCLEDDTSKQEFFSTPTKYESVEDSIDVTGSPLEIDLKGDVNFAMPEKTKSFDLWTEDEAKYFPLNMNQARQYINQHNYNRNSEEAFEDLPLFVICEDTNSNTVIVGGTKTGNKIMTCKIDILGYLSRDHEHLSLNYIEHMHLLNVRTKDCKTVFATKFKYYLYGTYIQNVRNIYESENFGSICIEVKNNNKSTLESLESVPSNKNMILQVIAGHPSSVVNFLWKNLCLLQYYIDILSNPESCNDPTTKVSSSKQDTSDIYNSINEIVKTFSKREIKNQFDIDNIRSENALDKLWHILKDCDKLSTLQDCFHYFFEELTEPEVKIKIPDNNSNIGAIVSGILEGKLAVPTITCAQALTFLFELGAEKLKSDYQTIIKHFYSMSEGVIAQKWNELQSSLTLQNGARKTRVTICLKSNKVDSIHYCSKLTYLGKLHVVVEMIYLVKEELFLRNETFHYFCEKVYEHYLVRTDFIEDFVDLQNSPRCEFRVNIDLGNEDIKNDIPSSLSIQMTSTTTNKLEVTTVYHFSKSKIFPPTIYDRYDFNADLCDPRAYYVCKLEMIKEVL